ncbi:MAG: molybdopterin cofactor-binding domain-containing protein [Geminicoccaceae bacterium]
MLVEGQVHGGIVQGIGQALLEHTVYDEQGQLMTGSFMDYCMPRADDLPSFDFSTVEVRCANNAMGVKGCGEAGSVGFAGGGINAIVDAPAARHFERRHAGDARETLAPDPRPSRRPHRQGALPTNRPRLSGQAGPVAFQWLWWKCPCRRSRPNCDSGLCQTEWQWLARSGCSRTR